MRKELLAVAFCALSAFASPGPEDDYVTTPCVLSEYEKDHSVADFFIQYNCHDFSDEASMLLEHRRRSGT